LHLHERYKYEGKSDSKFAFDTTNLENIRKAIFQSLSERGLFDYLSKEQMNFMNLRISNFHNDQMFYRTLTIQYVINGLLWLIGKKKIIDADLKSITKLKLSFNFGKSFNHSEYVLTNNIKIREQSDIQQKLIYYKLAMDLEYKEKYHDLSNAKRDKLFNKYIKKYGADRIEKSGVVINYDKLRFFPDKKKYSQPIGTQPSVIKIGYKLYYEILKDVLHEK
jgi:hypothetical protein